MLMAISLFTIMTIPSRCANNLMAPFASQAYLYRR